MTSRNSATGTDRPPDTPRKTVMFCPECGDGNDITELTYCKGEDGSELALCPACDSIVNRRAKTYNDGSTDDNEKKPVAALRHQ